MTPADYTKYYRDPTRAAAASIHLSWLHGLDSGVRLPELRAAFPTKLRFEHLGHRHPGPRDLPLVAQALGRLHAAAHRQLPGARLYRPFTVSSTLTIPDFITGRTHALEGKLLALLPILPVAIYKDANVRNTLLTATGIALIDFDELTLAPFGYDLAKLIVSAGMTYGRLPHDVLDAALHAYNQAASSVRPTACPPELLRLYAGIHHRLTASYLGRNGYRHDWAQIAPWPTTATSPSLYAKPGRLILQASNDTAHRGAG
jgi:hypothetical protein